MLSSGEIPPGALIHVILFSAKAAGLYMLDILTSRKTKVLDGIGRITEPKLVALSALCHPEPRRR